MILLKYYKSLGYGYSFSEAAPESMRAFAGMDTYEEVTTSVSGNSKEVISGCIVFTLDRGGRTGQVAAIMWPSFP